MKRIKHVLIAVACLSMVAAGGASYWQHRQASGEVLFLPGRLREAQLIIRGRLAKEPSSPDLHERMGELQLALGDPVAAEKELRHAAALGASKSVVVPALGKAMLQQGRFGDVLRLAVPKGDSPAVQAGYFLMRAEAQLAANDLPGAEAELAAARAGAPGASDTSLIAARVAMSRSDPAAALAAAENAVTKDRANLDALLLLVRLRTQAGRPDEALEAAERAVSAVPWSTEARVALAYLMMARNEPNKAATDVDLVLRDRPTALDAVYLKAVLLFGQGNYADAAAQLSRLERVGERYPQILFYQSRIATVQHQPETAAELARRYNTLVPDDPDGVTLLGNAELTLGRAAAALPVVKAFALAHPGNASTQVTLGRLLDAAGDKAGALRILTAQADRGTAPQALQKGLGLALLGAGDPYRALPLLEMAAHHDMADRELLEGLTVAAIDLSRFDLVSTTIEKLRALQGSEDVVGNLSGLAKLKSGDLAGAKQEWTDTISRVPGAVGARFNLARLLTGQGDTVGASAQLRRILAQNPVDVRALELFIDLSNGQPDLLRPRLEAAFGAQPRNVLFVALMANFFLQQEQPQAALDTVSRGAGGGAMPDLLLPIKGRAELALQQTDEAIATLREAFRVFPQDDATRSLLFSLVRTRDGTPGIMSLLRTSIDERPGDPAVLSALVELTRQTEGLDAALKAADLLRANPANLPAAAILRGQAFAAAGLMAQSAEAYKSEFDRTPSLALLLAMAAARAESGDEKGAEQALRDWVTQHSDAAAAWNMLAKLAMRGHRYDQAKAALEKVLLISPDDGDALNNLAWVYHLTGDRRSVEAARNAFLRAPSADSADTLGWVLISANDVESGLSMLKLARQRRPGDTTILFHLAVAMVKVNQTDDAKELLQAVVAVNSGPFENRRDAEALLSQLRSAR